jgi:ribosomal protein S6
VEAVIPWGKRRMSFAIGKHREGVYVHTRLLIEPRTVTEVRRLVSMTEEILRTVVTTAVGKLPEPGAVAPPGAAAAPAPPVAAGGPAQPAEA